MGSSKAQTVGFRYSLGAHLALCHGPVDAIREIRVDDRTAWSITTGKASAAPGAGVGAQATFGTVAGMSAIAGGGDEDTARIRFPGTLAGLRLGQSYDLALGADGVTRTVTLRTVGFDGDNDITTWGVEPKTTAFAAQTITVREAAGSGATGVGAGAGGTSTGGATGTGTGGLGGRIRIDAPNLFGGESREGGIVGDIDVLMGGPGQGANDYLAANAGADVPGYRGLCSLVLRQVYLGLNPYLKPWAVRLTRILTAADGQPQWYPEKAQIVPEARIGDAAIYIAMDASGSMSGTRMAAQIAAVATLIAEIGAAAGGPDALEPNDLQIVTYNAAVSAWILRREAGADAYAALESWVRALPTATSGGTDYGAAVSEAAAFYAGAGTKRRLLIFVTDGEPSPATTLETAKTTLAGIADVEVFAFNIALSDTSATAQLDNTPLDGVPVVPPGDPDALVASLRLAFGAGPDMNPAHILRECLTNPDWGLGHTDSDIGASFATAADTLFAEGFGLSLLWQQDSSIEDFLVEVLGHIDAQLYVDRRSGRWELRLIRADYDPATLPVFDATNVIDWGALGRREAADLVNSVTVTYTDVRSDRTGSVGVTDTALVQSLGQVIATTLDYPGIRFERLAVRVAERDLRALSAPVLTGEITVNRAGAELDPGDVIQLRDPARGLDGVAVRVVEIDHGDGRTNGVRLKIAEDVFALGATALVGGAAATPAPLTRAPIPLARRLVVEAPYWALVQELGHVEADAVLAEDATLGAILAIGEQPSPDARAAQVWVDGGSGYGEEGATGFAPTALLAEAARDDPGHRVLTVRDWIGLADVTIGSLASLGAELVRIDGVDAASVTLGRGCLDTVPLAHPAGTALICWPGRADLGEPRFVAGESIGVKLLPETGLGILPLARAPEDRVTLAARAIRPLPPGNLRVDGLALTTLAGPEATLTWAHRDRLAQTAARIDAYTAPDIGPEPGVAYALRIHWVDPATGIAIEPAARMIDLGQATTHTLTEADYPAPPIGTEEAAIRVRAVRGGFDDATFRELRVAIGAKVQVTGLELTLLFQGTGIDVLTQSLVVSHQGPGIDLLAQTLVLDCSPPGLGVLGQELVVEMAPLVWTEIALVNPGFETGDLTGWTVVGSAAWMVTADNAGNGVPLPPEGGFFARPLADASTAPRELRQVVDIGAQAGAIDAGTAAARVSALNSGWDLGNDVSRLALDFLDAAGAATGPRARSDPWSSLRTDPWRRIALVAPLPPGTRRVAICLIGEHVTGAHVDAYFDAVRLEIGS